MIKLKINRKEFVGNQYFSSYHLWLFWGLIQLSLYFDTKGFNEFLFNFYLPYYVYFIKNEISPTAFHLSIHKLDYLFSKKQMLHLIVATLKQVNHATGSTYNFYQKTF